MSVVDMELATKLVQEVINVAEAEQLLAGEEHDNRLGFQYGGSRLTCEIRDVAEYVASIDVKVSDTPYVCLEEEILSKVETCYRTMQAYGPQEIKELVRNAIDSVSESIDKSERVKGFAQEMYRANVGLINADELLVHTRTTIARHFAGVIYARALTLSKRYGPTEVLLEAYRAGLFPFGWDWEVEGVLCVVPVRRKG